MASRERVRWSQLRVGILAVVAMAIAAVLILMLSGQTNIFEGQFGLRTYMDDSAGMTSSDPVRLNGILVGHIGSIRLSGLHDPKKTVQINMVIQRRFLDDIPENSTAAIDAANLLGSKYINITRGTSPQPVQPGGVIESVETQDIPEIIAQSSRLLAQFQTIVGRVDGLLTYVESGKGNVGKLIKDDTLYDRLNATAGEVRQLVKDVQDSNGTISRLLYDDTLYNDIRKPIERIDDVIAQVQAGKGTAGKLIYDPQLYSEARDSIGEARKMLDNLNAGKGTAGKLLTDDQIYGQLQQITAKVNVALDKMNSGQGTIGQLMVNRQLYDTLNATLGDTGALIRDIRANPKKFLTLRLALF